MAASALGAQASANTVPKANEVGPLRIGDRLLPYFRKPS
jgi:hypothetical protein